MDSAQDKPEGQLGQPKAQEQDRVPPATARVSQNTPIPPVGGYRQANSVRSGPLSTISEPNQVGSVDGSARSTTSSLQSPWGTSSGHQMGHGGQQDPSDRVFPIRSVVSVGPLEKWSGEDDRRAMSVSDSVVSQRLPNARLDSETPASRTNITSQPSQSTLLLADEPPDHDSEPERTSLVERVLEQGAADPIPDSFVTYRFKHVMTDEGHAVITGRDGTLQRCEDEPIHTPGAVQAFGLMVVLREDGVPGPVKLAKPEGRLAVRYVSENSKRIIGYTPQELFKLESFTDILSGDQAESFLEHIDFIRDEDADPAVNGPEVFTISVRPPTRNSVKFWCALHINPVHPDLIICEFELEDDTDNPLRPVDDDIPDTPEDTLNSNPTLEDLTESTEILSKPLRVLRSARRNKGAEGAMQAFDMMAQIQEQLSSASTIEIFLKILVGIVRELTGFHRVMIYQFDASFNGKVTTESVDITRTSDLYYGLHFPASDIPAQARAAYLVSKVRLLYDRDQETARMVCRDRQDLEVPLDMTHAYLRAMSPIHLKYLANMAVRSSMSISITAFNELWGLISCHSYGKQGMRVSFPIRKISRLIGDIASRNIEKLTYANRRKYGFLSVATVRNPSGYIAASSEDLLKLFASDCGLLSIRGETKILGKVEKSQEVLALLEYLRLRKFTSLITSQDLMFDFPDLRYPPGFSVISGLLYVPLSSGGKDFIVFFRRGQVTEVKWAGNPYEKIIKEGTIGYLEPRKSFKIWSETVRGKCRPWTEDEVETAAVLCLVYGKFIEVWREKERALQGNRLTRLLLANSAHEVRTPLHQVIQWLELALEGTLDQETRDNLVKSHSASKSLIYVINDLLDLTKAEEGRELNIGEVFDLSACLHEATGPFASDAKRKHIIYNVVEHPGLPKLVYGDQRRVRQAIMNVTANAVEHTPEGGKVDIELYVAEVLDRQVRIEILVQDTGRGMDSNQVEALFRDLEQVTTDLDESLVAEEQEKKKLENSRTLGLGLAVVARIVRNLDGQLKLRTSEGNGCSFVIQLPFGLTEHDTLQSLAAGDTAAQQRTAPPSAPSIPASLPPAQDGEILLVDSGSSTNSLSALKRQRSLGETHGVSSRRSTSRGSGRSSKSDADRLIDAIQTPLLFGELGVDAAPHSRDPRWVISDPSSGSFGFTTTRSLSTDDRTERPVSPIRQLSAPEHNVTVTKPCIERSIEELVVVSNVAGSNESVKPANTDESLEHQPETPQRGRTWHILSELPDKVETPASVAGTDCRSDEQSSTTSATRLQVLIAEDDPVNLKLLSKRLERAGYDVYHTVNGQDCADVYAEKSKTFDVVLMDMQMPIVDGLTSTKMIRAIERSDAHKGLSPRAANLGRIPIFAVSASIVESLKDTYVSAGFDGWILKPIDFKRVEIIMQGIADDDVRNDALYVPGHWERGGWFRKRTDLPGLDSAVGTTPLPVLPLAVKTEGDKLAS